MQFGSLTLLSLATAVALLIVFSRVDPSIGATVVLVVMPAAIMTLALTLPRTGRELDPSGPWYFALLVRTWLLTIVVFLVASFLFAVFPNLQERLSRLAEGDSRVHQVWIQVDCTDAVLKEINSSPKQLFYENGGLIGEVHKSQEWRGSWNGPTGYAIAVSTDRSDFPPNWIVRAYTVVLDSNRQLVIVSPK